jgi:hypothetical protein
MFQRNPRISRGFKTLELQHSFSLVRNVLRHLSSVSIIFLPCTETKFIVIPPLIENADNDALEMAIQRGMLWHEDNRALFFAALSRNHRGLHLCLDIGSLGEPSVMLSEVQSLTDE